MALEAYSQTTFNDNSGTHVACLLHGKHPQLVVQLPHTNSIVQLLLRFTDPQFGSLLHVVTFHLSSQAGKLKIEGKAHSYQEKQVLSPGDHTLHNVALIELGLFNEPLLKEMGQEQDGEKIDEVCPSAHKVFALMSRIFGQWVPIPTASASLQSSRIRVFTKNEDIECIQADQEYNEQGKLVSSVLFVSSKGHRPDSIQQLRKLFNTLELITKQKSKSIPEEMGHRRDKKIVDENYFFSAKNKRKDHSLVHVFSPLQAIEEGKETPEELEL